MACLLLFEFDLGVCKLVTSSTVTDSREIMRSYSFRGTPQAEIARWAMISDAESSVLSFNPQKPEALKPLESLDPS